MVVCCFGYNSVGANFCYQEEPKKDDIEGEEAGWLCVALAWHTRRPSDPASVDRDLPRRQYRIHRKRGVGLRVESYSLL